MIEAEIGGKHATSVEASHLAKDGTKKHVVIKDFEAGRSSPVVPKFYLVCGLFISHECQVGRLSGMSDSIESSSYVTLCSS